MDAISDNVYCTDDQSRPHQSMTEESEALASVNAAGQLVLPAETVARLGLQPGAQIRLDQTDDGLHLRPPASHLAKVYVEPTNGCNLGCRTCIRNTWDEAPGQMTAATFARVVEGLHAFTPLPSVFFGGFGEPLTHPAIVEMVAQVKALGAKVELITNGTLLTPDLSHRLIAAGLDVLWLSLDGATPESYTDVRLGAALPQVLDNMAQFRDARPQAYYPKPEIGIAFVAMKRNIADLPDILRLGGRLRAAHFLVSNVLPYTADMCDEVLYARAIDDRLYVPSPWTPHVSLPKMDWNETTREPLYRLMRGNRNLALAGSHLSHANNRCPFIESGVTAVGWDGGLSPCLPLLHSHVSFVHRQRERASRRYIIGNVAEHSLRDLWHVPEYAAFRERVQAFEFSPCTTCGGCSLSETTEEDCFGNPFPTCGGCLWAQGVIQCP
jgi:MoaA/NifB/PqqE/SkfB family radical SAM enzyme